MLSAILAAAIMDGPTPREELQAIFARLSKAESCEATITHWDSSLFFMGTFQQKLSWRKGGAFILRTTLTESGTAPPTWDSNGDKVKLIYRTGRTIEHKYRQPRGVSPAWEACAGILFSFLSGSDYAKSLLAEPKPIKLSKRLKELVGDEEVEGAMLEFNRGSRGRIGEEEVKEITLGFRAGENLTHSGSIFLTPDGRGFVAEEIIYPDHTGLRLYSDVEIIEGK
jgi:hypothetical protein